MASSKSRLGIPVIVKKYANRRLYDTERSSYVTLDDLCDLIKEGREIIVRDARTGDDLTRQVMTQIIMEQESRGQNLLPVKFLRQLISYYGGNANSLVPNYLEHTLDTFARNQERLNAQINRSIGDIFPVQAFEELNRQNMALFEKAMRAFSPFAGREGETAGGVNAEKISALRQKIEDLEKEIAALQTGK